MNPKVTVVFRVWLQEPQRGDVIALFPYLPEGPGLVLSYMHVGQHGAAAYTHCISGTRPATPEEYAPLLRELQQRGYNLEVRQRYAVRISTAKLRDRLAALETERAAYFAPREGINNYPLSWHQQQYRRRVGRDFARRIAALRRQLASRGDE